MAYTADVTLIDPPSSKLQSASPTYTLHGAFDTVEKAEAAVAAHLTELGRDVGSATFDIKDENGQSVALRESDAD